MIVYFADRELNVLGTASTELPQGIIIIDDEKKEDIDSGVRTFSVTFTYDDNSRELVESVVAVGNFLLRSADDENEFYTIIETTHNTSDQTIQAYAEDAGLDLINTIAGTFNNDTEYNAAYYINKWLPEEWEIGVNELEGTQALEFTDESTVTERLLSIASSFDGELDFSYEIDRLTVTKRYVNFYEHRGSRTPTFQLRLGGDISALNMNTSIEDLATALVVTGGTLKGQNTPITLNGFDYSSDGVNYHTPADLNDDYQIYGNKVVSLSAMAQWSSKLDSDGLLLRRFQFDTTNKLKLFKKAVNELKKVKAVTRTYEITFLTFPKEARLGDHVYIVDDKDAIYLEGRILELEKSIIKGETKATLGEWLVRSSGISERLVAFANELQQTVLSATTITVTSSAGFIFNNTAIVTTLTASVWYGDEEITTQTRLEEVFGSSVAVNWYHNGSLVGTGFTYSVSSGNTTESYIVRVET